MSKCDDGYPVRATPGIVGPADFVMDVDVAFLNTDYNTTYHLLFGADPELREYYRVGNVQRPGECSDPPHCVVYQEVHFSRRSWDDSREEGVSISLLAEPIWTADNLSPYMDANPCVIN